MSAENEIGRMIVRLIGDGKSYINMMQNASRSTSSAAKEIEANTKRFQKAGADLQRVGAQVRDVGKSMQRMGAGLSLKVTAPLVALGTVATREFSQFDKAMTESTSIMGDLSAQTVRDMREMAVELSTNAVQGPEALARSYFYLASAGKSAEQSMSLLPGVARFATAGAFDMALATDLLTDAQSALGLSSKDVVKDTENLSRVADTLVKANTLANGTVQQFSESLTNTAGASLKSFNKDVEEGVAVLAAYADQGVKGNVAGTSLSRVMLLLSKASRDAAEDHERLGFRVFDSSGKMRNLADIVENLEQVTAGMSDETKSATLEMLGFEARIQQAVLPLLGTSDAIRRYEKELRKAGGITDEVANKQLKSFSNQMQVAKNRVSAVATEVGERLAPMVVSFTGVLTDLLEWWKGWPPILKTTSIGLAVVAAAIGPVLLALGGLLAVGGQATIAIGLMASNIVVATAAAALLAPALMALKVAAVAALAVGMVVAADSIGLFGQKVEGMNELLEQQITLIKERETALGTGADKAIEKAEKEMNVWGQIVQLEEERKRLQGVSSRLDSAVIDQNLRAEVAGEAFGANAPSIMGMTTDARLNKEFQEKQAEELRKQAEIAHGELAEIDQRLAELRVKGEEERAQKLLEQETRIRPAFSPDLGLLPEGEDLSPEAIAAKEKAREKDAQLASEVDRLTERLRIQSETFGMSADEVEIYRLRMSGVSETELSQAKSLAIQNKERERQAELMERGKSLTERFLSPQERLQKQQEEYRELLQSGAISVGTYERAMKDAQETAGTGAEFRMSVSGLQAVEVGTAEAMARVADFRAGKAFEPNMQMEAKQSVTNVAQSDSDKLDKIATGIRSLVEIERQALEKPGLENVRSSRGLA